MRRVLLVSKTSISDGLGLDAKAHERDFPSVARNVRASFNPRVEVKDLYVSFTSPLRTCARRSLP